MSNKHIECGNCDAVFKIKHDMDTDFYEVKFCPFCQEPLNDEELFEQEEDQIE